MKKNIRKITFSKGMDEIGLNPYTLRFDGGLEQRFLDHYFMNSLRQVRISTIMAIIFVSAFGLLDYIIFPNNYADIFIIRYMVIVPVCIGFLPLTYTDIFRKYMQIFLSFIILWISLGTLIIINIAPEPYNQDYYAGLIITLMFGYSFFRARFVPASITGLLVLAAYIYLISVASEESLAYDKAYINTFFLATSDIIGMFICYSIEFYARKNFYLSTLLNNEKDKVKDTLNELKVEVEIRKLAEEELTEAKNNISSALEQERKLSELKSRFISVISHEYRTPLTVILSSTYLLENYFDIGDKTNHSAQLHTIQESIKSMTKLLEDVLKIGRSDSRKIEVQPETINLVPCFRRIMDEIKMMDDDKHEFDFDSLSDKIMMVTDERLIYQILTNLLTNAVKYSDKGTPIRVRLEEDQRNIIFSVMDNGIGIPEDEKELIFEPFHRFKNVGAISGAGLGLSIVKRSVDRLNGNITFKSDIGRGTAFTVVLPK